MMKKEELPPLTRISVKDLRRLVREEYARGIPDFVTSNAASNCAEEMKRHLVRYVQQKANDPRQQRELLGRANVSLDDMEKEIKEVIEKHMMAFIYNARCDKVTTGWVNIPNMPSQQNKVELIGYYGSDETHALSAWTSTSRDLTEDKKNRIPKLLKMLAENGHETPFEKSSIHFLVTSDIASHIHLLKHRIGVSINAESARYKELKEDKYHVPVDWDLEEREQYIEHMEASLQKYHSTLERLVQKGMSRKRAKESARLYLPYGNQITADVMFNFRSFVHFLRLRYSDHAQVEIKDIAKQMLDLVVETNSFSATLEAFGLTNGNELRGPFT